ncbi:MAG: MarC family protein [Alphaproteobacteria bacterium]|jgi:multiple antibiotic resistance protein|nr:MarC family protein [Alphaproteobacteria bacterium]
MLELYLAAFATFFVLINPAGVAVTFASLTGGYAPGHRISVAVRAVMIAAVVLFSFGFMGQWLLGQLGVSLDSFRIAGGVLLFLIAVDMLFERRQARREETAAKVAEARAQGQMDDISVFPLAIPLITGPGAIATMLLFFNEHTTAEARAAVLAAAGANLLLTLGLLLAVGPLIRVMGATVLMVMTRIFGIMLAALAAQFVVDGVRGAFHLG